MVECWVICLAAIHTPNGSSTVQLIMSVVYGDEQSHIGGGSDHCACLIGSDVTGSNMTFSPTFFPQFPVLFPVLFFRTFFPRILFLVLFPPYFPRTFFPYYFPVLFQKSRRLKYNVLKYQLVVFLVHVVIRQFMFLAKYPFKRHPQGFPLTGGIRACAI